MGQQRNSKCTAVKVRLHKQRQEAPTSTLQICKGQKNDSGNATIVVKFNVEN